MLFARSTAPAFASKKDLKSAQKIAVEFDSDSSLVTPVGDNGSGEIFAGSLTVSGSGEIQLNDATLTLNGNGTMPTMGGTVTLIANQIGQLPPLPAECVAGG